MNNCRSLYIHIPFCVRKCRYCSFYSHRGGEDEFDAFTEAMKKRISSLPFLTLDTVYFGGGTPTLLGAKRIAEIMRAVDEKCRLQGNAEITLEVNPDTVTEEDFRIYSENGFNRLSIGMQSADDEILKTLGRNHDNATFLTCYKTARRFFDNISLDMIFSLPGGGTEKTVKQILELSPEHISAYSLMLEENTSLYRMKDKLPFPSEDEEEREYDYICGAFNGYEHYEISSFAKAGYKSRHNSGYWKRTEYIGLGPAAHSFYMEKRFSVPPDTSLFIKNSGKPFLCDTDFGKEKEITKSEAEEERIMLGLRTSDGAVIPENKIAYAKRICDSGYGTLNGNRLILNSKGFRVSNSIIADIVY